MKNLARQCLAALLIGCALGASVPAAGQAVPLTGAARFKITLNCVSNTLRCTGDIEAQPNTAPFWHASGDTSGLIESSIDLVQGQAASINLNTRCSDNEEDVLVITQESGSVTGMSLTAGVFSGTPTVVQAPTPVFRCSDGALFDDTGITFNVAAPGVPDDSVPDSFSFTPQSDVTQSATITSAAAVISGINIASTVTVSGGTWNKNGGAYTASAGTVVAGDSVTVRHTASASASTSTQTILTIGGVSATFTSVTVASPARVGIIYRLSASSLTPRVNPESAQWDAPLTSATDGTAIKHAGLAQYGLSAAVRALPHLEIVSGNGECGAPLDSDGKWLRGTLYPLAYSPVVNYGPLNSGPDKPRIDLLNNKAHDAIGNANSNAFIVEKEHHFALGICLPSTYVEDTDAAREFLFFIQGSKAFGLDASSSTIMSLSIKGDAGGAVWEVERKRITAAGEFPVDTFSTPVTNAHKGAWVIHSFDIRLDNRTVGATPIFEWVMNVNGQAGTVIASDNTTKWGMTTAVGSGRFTARLNLPYKGTWHGATAPGYTGNKTSPVVIGMDAYRIGDLTSSYSDVHPTRDAHP